MKAIYKIAMFLLILALVSCEDETNASLGDPLSKVNGLSDTWELTGVTQVDELQSFNNTRDVSNLFLGNNPAEITFETEDNSYSVEVGSSRILIPQNGFWAFDNDEYPTEIMLESGNEQVFLELQASVREKVDNQLIYKIYREPCFTIEEPGPISYIFTFQRK